MSKSVLISIRPEWVEKIANEIKTVEVRKTKPHLDTPFKCYIYCTNTRPFLVWGDVFRGDWCTEFTRLSGYGRAEADRIWDVFNGHVAGEFTCDNIATYNYDYCPHPEIGMDYDCGDSWWEIADEDLKSACLTEKEFRYYAFGREAMYGWHISKLQIYDTPKPLSAFKGLCKIEVGCGECPYYNYTKMECDGRTIKRPPQSWCYVEELK